MDPPGGGDHPVWRSQMGLRQGDDGVKNIEFFGEICCSRSIFTNRAEFFMGTREAIIYQLVSTNPGLGFFGYFRFLDPKKGRGPTGAPMSLGPQNSFKKVTHLVDLLGHLLSRNHVSNFSDLGPPPP